MSYRTLTTKQTLNTSIQVLLKRGAHIGLGLGAFAPVLALANPTGGQVVTGSATIKNPNANTTVVKQSSQSAIIDWQQFNIGKGQYVQFLQPSSSSVILNRVIGGGGTSIFGSLTGNGQVFLVNTNGVFFGKGASIDAQGFLASTLDISDSNFLSGHYLFDKGSNADAQVINQGSITAHKGGYVVLAGDYAENDGLISAQSGHIVLASGAKSTLTLNGNSLVSYAINQATLANLAGANNAGKLSADGGTVLMTADVANLLKATVVNNTGLIEAHAISKDGGSIQLLATGGNIQNAGTIDASATHAGQQGGTITLKGDGRTTLTDASKIVATGDGANGGHVEVSGDTLSMRGVMTLGQGGNLLVDPSKIRLVAGSGGGSNKSAGIIDNTGTTSIGVGFIETQLNAGATVAISAHSAISHASNVTAISATGKGAAKSTLKFEVNNGVGVIDLGGMDINVAGKLSASMHSGSFGLLQAASINFAAGGEIKLEKGKFSAPGKIGIYSAKATTGNLVITGGQLGLDGGTGEAGIALDAVKGSLDVTGTVNLASQGMHLVSAKSTTIHDSVSIGGSLTATVADGHASFDNIRAHGGINISATTKTAGQNLVVRDLETGVSGGSIVLKDTGGDFVEKGGNEISAGGGINLSAKHIRSSITGLLTFQTSDDLTLKGIIGATSAEGLGASLQLFGGVIKVDHSIRATAVAVQGVSLAYTGAGNTFAITASDGDLELLAPIGTAAAPVKYNVKLTDDGRHLIIGRDIYTGNTTGKAKAAANITATEVDTAAGTSTRGLIVGSNGSQALTLSAKGAITLTGEAVGIGSALGLPTNSYTQITLKAGKNIGLTATGHGSDADAGRVAIQGGDVQAGDAILDRSILVQAGGNLTITAAKGIFVSAGYADIHVNNGSGNITGEASVTLKATGNVSMTAGTSLDLFGGEADAHVGGSPEVTRGADAVSGLNLIAGKAMSLAAHSIDLAAGTASAGGAITNLGVFTATAMADLDVTVGTTLSATAVGALNVSGGDFVGHHAEAFSSLDGVKVTAIAHGDANIHAGTLKFKGQSIGIHAGSHVLGSEGLASSIVAENGAETDVTYTTNVNITGGAGGASFDASAGSLVIGAGSGAGRGARIQASGGGKVDVMAQANVHITATGAINLTGKDVNVEGGAAGAHAAVTADSDGDASLQVLDGVSIQGAAVSITAKTGDLKVLGGDSVALEALVSAGTGATASLTGSGAVALAATKGDVTIKAPNIDVLGGSLAAAGHVTTASVGSLQLISGSHYRKTVHAFVTHPALAEASGFGATATLTGKAGVSISATGNVTLSQSHAGTGSLNLHGGSGAGAFDSISATQGGTAKISADSGLSIKAGATLALNAKSRLDVVGGAGAGAGHSASTILHQLFTCASVNSCVFSGTTSHSTGLRPGLSAKGTHSKVLGSADASVSLQGANVAITANDQSLQAGGDAGAFQSVTAANGGSAAEIAHAGLSVKASKAFTDKGSGNSFQFLGAHSDGFKAKVWAIGQGAKASLQTDAQFSITAGTLSVTTPHQFKLAQGHAAFSSGSLLASHGGSAQVDLEEGVQLSATGAASFKASDLLWTGTSHDVAKAQVFAKGGDASVDVGTGLRISGATVQLTAGGVELEAGKAGADLAHIKGSAGGSAAVAIHGGLDITAVTALGITAIGRVAILGASYGGVSASVTAHTGKATLDLEGQAALDVTAKTGTIIVQAQSLAVGFDRPSAFINLGGNDAAHAHVSAASDGSAELAARSGVTLNALGAVKLNATSFVVFEASRDGGASQAHVAASNPDAHASLSLDSSISVTGGSLTVTAGKGITVLGANGSLLGPSSNSARRLGQDMQLTAIHGGSATATLDAHVSLKATTGALTLTGGSHSNDEIVVGGAIGAASGINITANNGQAKLQLDAGVDLTGATAVTLTAHEINVGLVGFDSSSSFPGGRLFQDGKVKASGGGSAAFTADVGTHITTKGTFTAKAKTFVFLSGNDTGIGSAGLVSAGAFNGFAHANVSVQGSLDIAAANVTIAGSSAIVQGGHEAGRLVTVQGSGSAAMQVQDGVDIQATKTLSITTTGGMKIHGGSSAAESAKAHAGFAGKGSLDVETDVSLQAAALNLSAGSSVNIAGGQLVAKQAAASSSFFGGSETLTAHAGVKVDVSGAFNVKAGANIILTAGSSGLGHGAHVVAAGSVAQGNHAAMVLGDAIQVDVGTAALKASGQVALVGDEQAGGSAQVQAIQRNGSAAFTADGRVDLDAKGAISVTATAVRFSAGASGGDISLGASHARTHASATLDTGVGMTAGGALTVKAATIFVGAGSGVLDGASVNATGGSGSPQVTATLHDSADVDIQAASITMTATSGITIQGGANQGVGAILHAVSGDALVQVSSKVGLKATGAMTLNASSFSIHGGNDSGGLGPELSPNTAGLTSFQGQDGVSLTAATLAMKAADSITIAGGAQAAQLQAAGGSAVAHLDGGVTIGATGALSLTATAGNINIHGGSNLKLLAQTGLLVGAPSSGSIPAPSSTGVAKVKGTLDASVSIQAGTDVTVKAGGNVTVFGGNKQFLALGAFRTLSGSTASYKGHLWAGGSADLSMDADAVIKAGHNLTVTAGAAGTGNLFVNGMVGRSTNNFVNQVTVRGGSNHAAADVSLTASGMLSAGNDVVLNAKGAFAVGAGIMSYMAADQDSGHVKLAVSADGTVHAGHDVVLNSITGNVVVGGGFGSTFGGLHDAGHTSISLQEAAAISAGHDIRSVKVIGGNLTVQGGLAFFGALRDVIGNSTQSIEMSASLQAGADLLLGVNGKFSALGGIASMHIAASSGHGVHQTSVDADTRISAPGTLSITAGQAINVIGGSVRLGASDRHDDGATVSVTGTAGVDITAGTLTLTAGGALKFRGGVASAQAEALSSASHVVLSASAISSVDVQVAHNVTLTAGKTAAASASFGAGNQAAAKDAIATAGTRGVTIGVSVDNGISLTAGGNLSLTVVGGGLHVFGGPSTENNDVVDAFGSGASVQGRVDSRVDISVAGNLTVAVKKGSTVTIAAADGPGQGLHVEAGSSADQSRVYVDTSVALTAGGNLSVTGATTLVLHGGSFGSVNVGSIGASLVAVADVSLIGKSVSLGITPTITSFQTLVAGGILQQGIVTVKITGPAPFTFAPQSTLSGLGTLVSQGLSVQLETVMGQASPTAATGTGFSPSSSAVSGGNPFPASCAALLLKAEAAQRCSVGGR